MLRKIIRFSLLVTLCACAHKPYRERIPASESAANMSCQAMIKPLLGDIGQIRKGAFDLLEKKNPSWVKKKIYGIRDFIRRRLQVIHEHPYPVIAIDTTPEAMGWAKYVFGELDPKSRELLDVTKIQTELQTRLKYIQNYQRDARKLINDLTDAKIRQKFFQEALDRGDLPAQGIEVKVPQITRLNEDGTLEYEKKTFRFGSKVQLEIHRNKAKDALDEIEDHLEKRAYQQVVAIKELETFRHEFLRQQALKPEYEVEDKYTRIIKQIGDIYESAEAKVIKEGYAAPTWAWSKLKWVSLRKEVSAILIKDIPKLKKRFNLNRQIKKAANLSEEERQALEREKQRLEKFTQFLKNMPEADRRALGIKDQVDKVNVWTSSKKFRLLIMGGTLLTGGGFSIQELYSTLYQDSIEKEKCAEANAHQQFLMCAQKYLARKFSNIFSADDANVLSQYLNEEKEIKNEDLLEEINDIIERRNQYIYSQNLEESLMKPAMKRMAKRDKGSRFHRERLVKEKDDKTFTKKLLAEDPKEGYLAFNHPFAYSLADVRSYSRQYVTSEETELKKEALQELKEITHADELVIDIIEIVKARKRQQQTQSDEQQLDQMIDDLIRGERNGGSQRNQGNRGGQRSGPPKGQKENRE